jgi:hypothetical protein
MYGATQTILAVALFQYQKYNLLKEDFFVGL